MKRTTVKLLSLLLCLAVCLSMLPTAWAAADKQAKVTGQFRYTEARKMIQMINDFRTKPGVWQWNEDDTTKTVYNTSGQQYLGTLKYDYDLEQVAMLRARELAVMYSHTRPNGESCFTLSVNNARSWGENIAYGFANAQSVFTAWCEENDPYAGQGHRRNILRPGYTAVGFGCFYYKGVLYWAQEFSYDYTNAPATSPSEADVTGYVDYDSSLVNWTDPVPEITQNPVDVTAKEGTTATFQVKANDASSYQWQYYNTSSSRWENVTNSAYGGLKTATMAVPVTKGRNGLQFRCVVSNNSGAAYSDAATLTVVAKPTISANPSSTTATAGTKATFKVSASGSGLSYQWQYYNSSTKSWANVTNSEYSGLKTATMTVPATTGRNGLQFRCAVTNAAGTVYSSGATLTVTKPTKPTITTNPQNATASAGSNATFKVSASGSGLSYQWQYYTGSSWANVTNSSYSGLKTATMTVPATTGRNGLKFRCAVTNAAGTVYSGSATLTVTKAAKPTITANPQDAQAEAGTKATFKVSATAATSYQWQYYTGSRWANVTNSAYSGLKTATMTVPATMERNGLQFRCAVTNSVGTVYSGSARLTVTEPVLDPPHISSWTSSVMLSSGGTAEFSVSASGNGLSYQWQYSANGGKSWGNITNSSYSGIHSDTLSVPATTERNGYLFRCIVSNSAGTATSDPGELIVSDKPLIADEPVPVTADAGTTAVFEVFAIGCNLRYQWQYSDNGGKSWGNITNSSYTGIHSARLGVPATKGRNGLLFRCVVTNDYGTATSASAKLTVK